MPLTDCHLHFLVKIVECKECDLTHLEEWLVFLLTKKKWLSMSEYCAYRKVQRKSWGTYAQVACEMCQSMILNEVMLTLWFSVTHLNILPYQKPLSLHSVFLMAYFVGICTPI